MRIAALVVVCAGIGMLAWGQGSTAQIRGVIRDASGSVVAGADVKVTQTATGAVRNVKTGEDGTYTLTFSYPSSAPAIASTLAKAAEAAEDVGFIPA
jgi:hypothetical protein